MTSQLTPVSTGSLERVREALVCGRLRVPLSSDALVEFGLREQLDTLAAVLGGLTRDACVAVLDAVLAERVVHGKPPPEVVWTGPEGSSAIARDTAVVLQQLFESARARVVLAGYSFSHATELLQPLHATMLRNGVRAHFFVDITQAAVADTGDEYGRQQLRSFMQTNWPFGAPYPEVYCDKRALRPGPPYASLHAKCVVVDGERAFVSSANFTSRGQNRNIEVGVLLDDVSFAGQLERQWMSLVSSQLVLCWAYK